MVKELNLEINIEIFLNYVRKYLIYCNKKFSSKKITINPSNGLNLSLITAVHIIYLHKTRNFFPVLLNGGSWFRININEIKTIEKKLKSTGATSTYTKIMQSFM